MKRAVALVRWTAGIGLVLLGGGLLLLQAWDWLLPVPGQPPVALAQRLPMLGLSLMWLAVGLWLLRRRGDKAE